MCIKWIYGCIGCTGLKYVRIDGWMDKCVMMGERLNERMEQRVKEGIEGK